MTTSPLYFFSIPGLRDQDLAHMPNLVRWMQAGEKSSLTTCFPAVTWPAQAAMLTGRRPKDHGVVANGFFWRDKSEVEMWTAWNDKIQQPQIWDTLASQSPSKKSAVWFPMLSKGCGAEFVCMPAPIHNPDGSESLWCYTHPKSYYGDLRDQFGHFPLKHFWGPLAGIPSSQWIMQTAAYSANKLSPDFFYIYVPHLDYAAQKLGPNSDAAIKAVVELDGLMSTFFETVSSAQPNARFIVASEYVINEVSHVSYPNRVLRSAGLLKVKPEKPDAPNEQLDFVESDAWALVDHQFSHVFVRNRDPQVIAKVASLFTSHQGIAEVLVGEQRSKYDMQSDRSGDVILISEPNSWQAYYWWLDDQLAPSYARTVDIHRKPGYDPVELHFDFQSKCIPLDASLIRGSHGAPPSSLSTGGIVLCNQTRIIGDKTLKDIDIHRCLLEALS